MNSNIIHYGFGKDYLKDWEIKHALREIYQNFLDYGEYEDVLITMGDVAECTLSNAWQPESLEFLRIGNSQKASSEAIGKHGEGLKMAFLILLREGFTSRIMTPKYAVHPQFYIDKEIGECFCFEYEEHGQSNVQYSVQFQCKYDDLKSFREDIIRTDDILFDDKVNGKIVNRKAGNIYSGGLFVIYAENFSHAYDILPSNLPLDRDRRVPAQIDLEWHTAKIKTAYGKFSVRDFGYSDSKYMSSLPNQVKAEIKPRMIGNDIHFTYKNEKGKTEVISSDYIKENLKQDSFFTAAIKKLKRAIAKQLGLYEMLIAFGEKHVRGSEAKADFELILDRVGKDKTSAKKKAVEVEGDLLI